MFSEVSSYSQIQLPRNLGAKDPAFPDWLIAFDPSICLPPALLIGRLRFDRPIGLHPASGAASPGSLLAAPLDLLSPASALVRHWWSPFDSSIQQLIVCPRFSSVASLASHWSSRGLFLWTTGLGGFSMGVSS